MNAVTLWDGFGLPPPTATAFVQIRHFNNIFILLSILCLFEVIGFIEFINSAKLLEILELLELLELPEFLRFSLLQSCCVSNMQLKWRLYRQSFGRLLSMQQQSTVLGLRRCRDIVDQLFCRLGYHRFRRLQENMVSERLPDASCKCYECFDTTLRRLKIPISTCDQADSLGRTSVQVDFAPVSILTPTGPITQATGSIPPPAWTGSEGDMVYYAAFVGCHANKPHCCPWSVSGASIGPVASATITQRANVVAAEAGLFPVPGSSGQAAVASHTPCFSPFSATSTPPPITARLLRNPTESSLRTSAVVNLGWAMSYRVATVQPPPPSGLSTGAIIGIAVGAGLVGLAATGVAGFFSIRRRKKIQVRLVENRPDALPGVAYEPGYHAPPMASPPPPSVSAYAGTPSTANPVCDARVERDEPIRAFTSQCVKPI
ncbi:hypothetical protein B0H63DRAFT_565036 [Podospora didyma]|uniref:Uncharacterized protein n=1 Tax=Podospora didyma TaxID=330526 RepID=A0AAE0K2D1_9PEZI|nr:hypothetical protein B0H63DRAFT_565036 [Podospora didyma]